MVPDHGCKEDEENIQTASVCILSTVAAIVIVQQDCFFFFFFTVFPFFSCELQVSVSFSAQQSTALVTVCPCSWKCIRIDLFIARRSLWFSWQKVTWIHSLLEKTYSFFFTPFCWFINLSLGHTVFTSIVSQYPTANFSSFHSFSPNKSHYSAFCNSGAVPQRSIHVYLTLASIAKMSTYKWSTPTIQYFGRSLFQESHTKTIQHKNLVWTKLYT